DRGGTPGRRTRMRRGIEPPRLRLGHGPRGRDSEVFAHPLAAALAAEPAFAVAAETGTRVEDVGAVDPDHAGLDLRGDIEREADVLRPDRRGESVAGVVGELDRLVRRAE